LSSLLFLQLVDPFLGDVWLQLSSPSRHIAHSYVSERRSLMNYLKVSRKFLNMSLFFYRTLNIEVIVSILFLTLVRDRLSTYRI